MKGTTHAKSSVATRKAPTRRKAANTNDKGGATVRKRSTAVRGKRNTAVRTGSKPSSRTRGVIAARKSRTTSSVPGFEVTPIRGGQPFMQYEHQQPSSDEENLTVWRGIVGSILLVGLFGFVYGICTALIVFFAWAF